MATIDSDATERPGIESADEDADGTVLPTDRKATEDTYRVADPMDTEGYMRVRPLGRREELLVVDYADFLVRNRLCDLPEGATVRLDLTPAGESDRYAVARVLPGTAGVVA